MHVYQPIAGLHRPVVVDPTVTNFTDVSLSVRCLPGSALNVSDARSLCRKVGILFENQGASVETSTSVYAQQRDPDEDAEAARTDLVLELRTRSVHESNDPILWTLCYLTLTLVPAVTESTFAQDVVVRAGDGTLLARETLQGRLIRRFGVGAWAGNKLLNIWREDADKLTPETAGEDLSSDLYNQLSQIVFDAKIQREILEEAGAAGGGTRWD